MAIEQGVVIKLSHGPATAWVMTTRSSACESCAARGSCRTGATGKSQEVEALNTVGARVGDRIQMTIKTGSLLKATFLLYVFPILCMLGGAALGNGLAMGLGVNPSALAALGALAGFAAAMVIVRTRGRRMGSDRAYRPEIIRILGRAPQDCADAAPAIECPGTDENHKTPIGKGRHD